ncbi:MAG: AP2/ERF family transcription factor [Dehalococcoidia bacterium]
MRKKAKYPNIERIDYETRAPKKSQTIHAWEVFLNVNGERRVKIFSDSKFGGKKKALETAISYRDACLLTYQNMRSLATYRRLGLRKHNDKTEDVGVSLAKDRKILTDGTERVTYAWQAQWVGADGRHRSKRFTINKYGDEEAYRLAQKAREEGLEEKRKEFDKLGYHIPSVPHALNAPDDPNIKVWRYMDFTKLVSMLIHSGLFFSKIDNLDDPFEGSYSLPNVLWRKNFYKGDGPTWEELDINNKDVRQRLVINCWHMSEYESAAMWKLYSKSNEAICIQSTYNKLRQSLDSSIILGIVQYINYERDMIPEGNYHYPYLYKRESFEHERELRAIKTLDTKLTSDGIFVKTDLNDLIETVYIAPSSPDWFKELVENVLRHFGLPTYVERSQLDAIPLEGISLR